MYITAAMDAMIGFAVSACLAALTVLVIRRLIRMPAVPNLDRLSRFTADAYRPLARLLSTDDIAFLRSMPGHRPAKERMFRRERYRLFRLYLLGANADFRALKNAALYLAAQNPGPAPGLSRELSWLTARFQMERFRLQLRGWLYLAGWDGGAAAGSRAFQALESLRCAHRQVQSLVPASRAA